MMNGLPRSRNATDADSWDRPLRIALVHTADRGGGAEACTFSLLQALKQLGHQPVLYVGTKLTDHPDVTEIPRYRCFPGLLRTIQFVERKTGWQYLYQPWFRKLDQLFSPDVDVIHFQSLWGGQNGFGDLGGLPGLTRRYPSLMTLHDLWMVTGHCACPAIGCDRWKIGCGQCPDLSIAPAIKTDGTAFNWKRKRAAISRSNLHVTTVSNWLGDVARTSPIFAGKLIHTVYNGIDEAAFYPRDRAAVREKLGLPREASIVMLAGQSVEGTYGQGKGAVDFALQALAECERELFVLAVGRSSQLILQRWGKSGQAIPFQTDPMLLADYYCAADIVLVASLWETFGRVPAEAQMCGVPVVSFDTGGIPEIVIDGETGLLAPRLDASTLAKQLGVLAANPDLQRRFGINAAQRAKERFSNLVIAEQYVELYRAIIAERHGHSISHPLVPV